MPYDGIAFNDPGYKATPPSEMIIRAEMSSQAQAKTSIKKLDKSHKINPDGGKNSNSGGFGNKSKQKDENDSVPENKIEVQKETVKPTILNHSKNDVKYKVIYNNNKDLVELVDRGTGQIIETISPKDLMVLVSKSKTASGILVDRVI